MENLVLDLPIETVEFDEKNFAVTGWDAGVSVKPFGVGISFGVHGTF